MDVLSLLLEVITRSFLLPTPIYCTSYSSTAVHNTDTLMDINDSELLKWQW